MQLELNARSRDVDYKEATRGGELGVGKGGWEGEEGGEGEKETGLSFPISAIVPAFVVLVMWRVQKLKL